MRFRPSRRPLARPHALQSVALMDDAAARMAHDDPRREAALDLAREWAGEWLTGEFAVSFPEPSVHGLPYPEPEA